MAKIYRTSDIIPINIDGLTIHVSPLTFEQKMNVQSELLKGGAAAAMKAAALACRYAIKKINGIETLDGETYSVAVENGVLTEECWNDLQNVEQSQKMITVCLGLINGIPKDFVDPSTGETLKGVSIVKETTKKSKK